MFKIDTGQARTDLYGIGKGEAQVIDLSPIREANAQRERERFAKEQQEGVHRQERENEINKQLSALGSVAINPRDRPLFAQKQQALRDYTIANNSGLKNGDPNAVAGFQNMYGDILQSGEQSKNGREQWEAIAKEISANPSAYRDDSKEYMRNFMHPDQMGNFEFDPTAVKKNFDTAKYLREEVSPLAEKQANKGVTEGVGKDGVTYKTEHRNLLGDESKQFFHDKALSNPEFYDDETYKLGKEPDEVKSKYMLSPQEQAQQGHKYDVNAYMKDKYANKYPFVINDDKKTISGQGSAEEQNKNAINVTHTLDNTGGELHVMNPSTNEEATINHDVNGNITGGTVGLKLSPTEKAENNKNIAENLKRKDLYSKHLEVVKTQMAKEMADAQTPEEQQSVVNKFSELIPKPNDPAYSQLPVKAEGKEVDAQRAQELAFDKYKISPKEIANGKIPAHVNLQKIDKRSATPQKGEEKQVQGGTAVFNGTKWVMK